MRRSPREERGDGAKALKALRSLYPPDRFLAEPVHLAAYESDGLTAFRALPRAVVVPESADEVIATVRCCTDHDLPFVARGSGTSLSGGSLPVEDGVVIALNRMDRVLALDPDRRIAVVEPGTIVAPETAQAAVPPCPSGSI